jgi:hypothetical protein
LLYKLNTGSARAAEEAWKEMDAGSWLFLLDFALIFYVLGATFVEGFVNYRTWHLIGQRNSPCTTAP